VGDDDQAIYRFRGASVKNIINFESDFLNTKKVILSENYRSTQSILDHAYNFIQANNPDRLEAKYDEITKKLNAQTEDCGEIQHIHSINNEEEIKSVINKIIKLKQTPNVVWNDFAILVRSNAAGKDFANALEKQALPYQFLALSGLYKKPIVLDVIALMKVLDDPYDSASVYRMLNLDIIDLDPMTIAELNMQAQVKGKSLFDILARCTSEDFGNKEEATRITKLLDVLSKIRLIAAQENASEIFIKIIKETGYLTYLNNLDEAAKYEAFRCLQRFFERIKSFETRNDHPTLHVFLSEFSDERNAGEEGSFSIDPDAGPDMIRILTIHSSKGLEFKYVFIVNLIERRFPSQRRSESIPIPDGLIPDSETTMEQHIQEERRLLYVAITRAKKGVYFTSAENYGGARKRKISRFLTELNYNTTEVTQTDTQSILDEKKMVTQEMKKIHIALPKQFSFTQLSSFKLCPLQYKFAHIFKIPMSGKWTFSYGQTIHNTLEDYFKLWIERSSTETESIPVSIEELMDIYKARWEDGWYINDEQREKYRSKGEKELKNYYLSLKENLPKPISIEQGFKLKIDNVILKGRIDRVDTFEDGVEIIDYKTGTPKLKNKLKKSDKEQLYLYQIAASEILGLNPKKLTLHYIEDNSKVSFIANESELIKLKNDIIERVERIRSSKFDATPGFHCGYCDFSDICEFRQT
jgi:DNA helicase-2/ATP-dependent DNA helicase PcrA